MINASGTEASGLNAQAVPQPIKERPNSEFNPSIWILRLVYKLFR